MAFAEVRVILLQIRWSPVTFGEKKPLDCHYNTLFARNFGPLGHHSGGVVSPQLHDAAFAISRFSAEFTDRTVEAHYSRHLLSQTKAQLRTTLLLCAAAYLIFAITDVLALGFELATFGLLACRIAVAVAATWGCVTNHLRPHSVRRVYLAASVAEIVGMLAFAPVVLARPAEVPWHAMAMGLMVMVVFLYIPNRLIYALAIALVSTLVFIALAVSLHRLPDAELLSMIMLLLLANCFGYVGAYRYNVIRREEFTYMRPVAEAAGVAFEMLPAERRRATREDAIEELVIGATRRACSMPRSVNGESKPPEPSRLCWDSP